MAGGRRDVVLVVPLFLLAIAILLLVARYRPPTPVRATAAWLGRLALVAPFVFSLADLVKDTQTLVG